VELAALHLRIAAWFAVPEIAWPPSMWDAIDAAIVCATAGMQPE
jgi:hypothetical protein